MSAREMATARWKKRYGKGFVHICAKRHGDLVITVKTPPDGDKSLVRAVAECVERISHQEAIVCFGEVPHRMGLRKVR